MNRYFVRLTVFLSFVSVVWLGGCGDDNSGPLFFPRDGGADGDLDGAALDAGDGGGCVPKTCADFSGLECGTVSDGCSGTIDLEAECGAAGCTAPDTCGGGGVANMCGGCVPKTCADFSGLECGTVSDGCADTIDLEAECGAAGCTSPETCGGGGQQNVCGTGTCTPKTCADFAGLECGAVSDGCSGTVDLEADCGAAGCTAPQTCGGGGIANMCGGCIPKTCADFAGLECGTVSDGCSGTIDLETDCGAAGCTAPETCGGDGTPNMCGSVCVPVTCIDYLSAECGRVPDGCGGILDLVADCGAPGCTSPEVCGGPGNPADYPIYCGDPCPSRIDCNFLNSDFYECGVISDHCGGTIDLVADCGKPGCNAGEVCQPNDWGALQCDTGSCQPKTCSDVSDAECGTINDGCGGVINVEAQCGRPGCVAPEICGGGAVGPNRCGDPSCPFPRMTCEDFASLISSAQAAGEPLCGVIGDGCGGTIDLVADCGAPGCGSCQPGTPLPLQCETMDRPIDSMESKICLENASGCPGEVLEMGVWVIVPQACLDGGTGQRSIRVDGIGFELLNPAPDACGVTNCVRREPYQGNINWTQFPSYAIGCSDSQCPDRLATGHVDNLLIRIPVGHTPGDFPLPLLGKYLDSPCDACPGDHCEPNEPYGLAPTVRVY